MNCFLRIATCFFLACFLAACQSDRSIVNNIDEREANEIVVFLAAKGINAQKVQAVSEGAAAMGPSNMFDIFVESEKSTEAMALLNRYGLPRKQGTNLLELFAKSGLMSTEREEAIRYQAGLAEQICNTIRKIDGILDADVQISFPTGEPVPGVAQPKITAAVYVKHQGTFEDPNSHLETKIKRLLAASVSGLDYDNVTVISDRSRLADLSLDPQAETIGARGAPETYASIWSIVMTKGSLARFRLLFFSLIGLVLLLSAALGWMVYKFYPQLISPKQGEGPPLPPTPPNP